VPLLAVTKDGPLPSSRDGSFRAASRFEVTGALWAALAINCLVGCQNIGTRPQTELVLNEADVGGSDRLLTVRATTKVTVASGSAAPARRFDPLDTEARWDPNGPPDPITAIIALDQEWPVPQGGLSADDGVTFGGGGLPPRVDRSLGELH
jgi:hypothetical protein